MFAARILRLGSVGIDANRVAAAIAAAKVAPINAVRVRALAIELLDPMHEPEDVPIGSFWTWAYHPQTLWELCSLREQLLQRGNDPTSVVLRALVLGILHGPLRRGNATYLSNQMPRTYATKPDAAVRFWTKREMKPPYVDVLDTILRRMDFTLVDVPDTSSGEVHCGDSADILPRLRRRFDWVVTSPPYYGMRTYVPDQWLRNWFLGGPATVDYSTRNQISHNGVDAFVVDLAAIWKRTAKRCNPGTRMAVRFGALPSVNGGNAHEILAQSLLKADAGWTVREIVDAGVPRSGARQATQFGLAGEYASEVDCFAILD